MVYTRVGEKPQDDSEHNLKIWKSKAAKVAGEKWKKQTKSNAGIGALCSLVTKEKNV